MTKPIWWKGKDLDATMQRFCAGDDVVADRALFPFDVRATQAHVRGLGRIAVLTTDETALLVRLLDELLGQFDSGVFVVDDRYEDGHSAIEAFLTEKAGDTGKKVHTARSRNDQVLVALRLWLKHQLAVLVDVDNAIAAALIERARSSGAVAMPGYTHLQRAMPTTLQAFFLGHAEGFLDSRDAARAALAVIDKNPLGTGAGFGVSLALDRDGTASDLGFGDLVISPQAAQNSRGKLELFALQALHLATLDVRRLAWDLSLFVTAEFAFARLPDSFTTGSSLMPNKRNPDVVELLRTLPAVVEGALAETQAVLSLPSSYHRDLQATKAPTLRAFARALQGLQLVPTLIDGVVFDEGALRAAITPDLFATDRALELVVAGVPFRDAYLQAAQEILSPPANAGHDVDASLKARVSLGGAGNAGLERLARRLSPST